MDDDQPSQSHLSSPSPLPDEAAEETSSVSSPIASRSAPHPPAADMPPASTQNMTASSTPLGTLNAARGRPPPPQARGSQASINPDIAAKMKAFSMSRAGAPPPQVPGRGPAVQSPGPAVPGFPAGFRLPPHLNRPQAHTTSSSPAVTGMQPPKTGLSLAEKRGMRLPGGLPGAGPAPTPVTPATPVKKQKPRMTLSDMAGSPNGAANGDLPGQEQPKQQTQMEKYADFVDAKRGALTFKGKAVVHGDGIDFTSGRSFSISLDEVDTLEELGKGNYGTVYKVRHSRPKFRRAGIGLSGNKAWGAQATEDAEPPTSPTRAGHDGAPLSAKTDGTTGIIMAMKEMRLELDDAKFASIIMELDILHRCISPYIVDFYGAFFQEGAVYICLEFMDASLDKLYGDGMPEGVLRKVTAATTIGLKTLKEEHNIIHRDVKPTNILINTKGQIKICDFGVSGNLVASIAKTNIGCQSYMAPERISSGGVAQAGANPGGGTYSVQSDIWSLGLTIIECALGRYPYPPETYDNIFSQLSAIVDGEPPDLPADRFSEAARNFVAGCLNKIPKLRPTYPMLLQHAWLAPLVKPHTILEEDEEAAAAADAAVPGETPATAAHGFVDREVGEWVLDALDRRKRGVMGQSAKPALHAAPLDAVASPPLEKSAVVAPVTVDA